MMKAIANLLGSAPVSQIDALARQVAELSLGSVSQLVEERVEGMAFSEARGYVRARAARIVRKHASATINNDPGAEKACLDTVARAATERLVPLVLRQTRVGVPKKKTSIRLAA